MQRFLLYIFILMGCFSISVSCKKYPENDRIYLKSAKARLTIHDWHLNKITVNDIDSTEAHAKRFGTTPNNIIFTINSKLDRLTLKYPDAPNGYVQKDIVFDKKKKKMTVDEFQSKITNSIYIRLFILNEKHEWDIAKLTNETFVLTGSSSGNNYRFEFIK